MISCVTMLSITFALAIFLGSCSNSSNEETKGSDQETALKDSSENAVVDLQQPTSESLIDPERSQSAAPEKENAAENTANKNQSMPSEVKKSEQKNVVKPTETSKTISKPEKIEPAQVTSPAETQTSKVKTTIEQPESDPVIPVKTENESEETKVTSQPQPVPKTEPAVEKPKEVIVPQPVKEEPKAAQPSPGKWIVPAKDQNKTNPIKADAESISIGKSLYKKHCLSCHGKTGIGDGPKAAQLDTSSGDFTLSAFQSQTDGSLFYKTREGKGDMPGYNKKIPDEEDIWHIVNYIRTLK